MLCNRLNKTEGRKNQISIHINEDPAIKKIKRSALLIRRINVTHIFFFWNTGAGWIPCWVTEKTSAYIPIPVCLYWTTCFLSLFLICCIFLITFHSTRNRGVGVIQIERTQRSIENRSTELTASILNYWHSRKLAGNSVCTLLCALHCAQLEIGSAAAHLLILLVCLM
jgi:hypothetical protein